MPTDPKTLLNQKLAALYLGVSVRTMEGWRLRGGGPLYSKLGSCVRYRLGDLDAFVDGQIRSHTSQ
jgi:hypothetical protein